MVLLVVPWKKRIEIPAFAEFQWVILAVFKLLLHFSGLYLKWRKKMLFYLKSQTGRVIQKEVS